MSLTDEQHTRLETILQGLEPEASKLYPAARGFVEDQIKRHDEYGQDVRVSPKQWKWLEDLYKQFVPGAELPSQDYTQDAEEAARGDMRDEDTRTRTERQRDHDDLDDSEIPF